MCGVGVDEVVNVGIFDVKVCVLICVLSDEDEVKDDGVYECYVYIVFLMCVYFVYGLLCVWMSVVVCAVDVRSRRIDS